VKGCLDRIECPNVVVAMGNHDARNVGYRHFEDLFDPQERSLTVSVPEGEAKVVVLDSTKPDPDEGEVGRAHYAWLDSEFRCWTKARRSSSSTITSSPCPGPAATSTTYATRGTLWPFCGIWMTIGTLRRITARWP
jgi:hypothetical protein